MTRQLIFIFWISVCTNTYSQTDSLMLRVDLRFNKQKVQLNETYISASKDTLTFEAIRFYLSGITLTDKSQRVLFPKKSHHLIDSNHPETLQIKLGNIKTSDLESLTFNTGVDSLASVSGAMKGDLDATKDMYWAWQSGFINLKIEGKSNSCNTRKNKFQFHIGGYLQPYYAIRTITIPITKSQNANNTLHLVMDLGKLFSEIELTKTHSIMIPGKEAMKMADLTAKIFSIE